MLGLFVLSAVCRRGQDGVQEAHPPGVHDAGERKLILASLVLRVSMQFTIEADFLLVRRAACAERARVEPVRV